MEGGMRYFKGILVRISEFFIKPNSQAIFLKHEFPNGYFSYQPKKKKLKTKINTKTKAREIEK